MADFSSLEVLQQALFTMILHMLAANVRSTSSRLELAGDLQASYTRSGSPQAHSNQFACSSGQIADFPFTQNLAAARR